MLQGLGESVKQGAIDAMLEHFSIDAANPVICLTQACILVHGPSPFRDPSPVIALAVHPLWLQQHSLRSTPARYCL